MVSRVSSLGLFGLDAYGVELEADISSGLPSFDIVGLPDASVREARDRVRAAIKNCGYTFPVSRITVNLAPADIRKEGTLYDLPIFLAILAASGQIEFDFSGCAFLGELSLSGQTRPIRGVLPMAIRALELGRTKLFLPAACAKEAAVVEGLTVYPVENVQELLAHWNGRAEITPAVYEPETCGPSPLSLPDFSEVKGQFAAKRALEVAAAGGHNVLLIGPPGSGKSMLAKRLPSILPDMSFQESIETTKLHSVAGILPTSSPLVTARPFRSPHHTVSPAGLSGGGAIPRPGEISLAHNGVLFLDELPEFSRAAMEILRQPLEDGKVTISRAWGSLSYPCSAMVVCAMNPCPCGFFGHPTRECTCTRQMVSRYLNRISGPLLDRMDIHIEVPPVEFSQLSAGLPAERSADIKKRVDAARKLQQARYRGKGFSCNAKASVSDARVFALSNDSRRMFQQAFDKLGLSARAYDRILKVSRTIADLDGSEVIESRHVGEAIQYRSLDRKYWSKEEMFS